MGSNPGRGCTRVLSDYSIAELTTTPKHVVRLARFRFVSS